ncbi:uncharacterized protein LOC120517410 isoform X1 [Polypterus senegalus]|uniref:uncharacterized protein LOC120517410 isoform X1 n=1 Tax=Polypterus senegalus TaxID=55291 RepID=UPI0019660CA3|nr:uncharacterized protein LOC120517410 isoform X1 [Polypterus senegalus]XP_039595661.1 uncharacterized protein LOC120517410 isoform X1 [Polypterus senegalus]
MYLLFRCFSLYLYALLTTPSVDEPFIAQTSIVQDLLISSGVLASLVVVPTGILCINILRRAANQYTGVVLRLNHVSSKKSRMKLALEAKEEALKEKMAEVLYFKEKLERTKQEKMALVASLESSRTYIKEMNRSSEKQVDVYGGGDGKGVHKDTSHVVSGKTKALTEVSKTGFKERESPIEPPPEKVEGVMLSSGSFLNRLKRRLSGVQEKSKKSPLHKQDEQINLKNKSIKMIAYNAETKTSMSANSSFFKSLLSCLSGNYTTDSKNVYKGKAPLKRRKTKVVLRNKSHTILHTPSPIKVEAKSPLPMEGHRPESANSSSSKELSYPIHADDGGCLLTDGQQQEEMESSLFTSVERCEPLVAA